jgi:hypothetical protein
MYGWHPDPGSHRRNWLTMSGVYWRPPDEGWQGCLFFVFIYQLPRVNHA